MPYIYIYIYIYIYNAYNYAWNVGFTQCNHPKHNNPWWVVYKPSPNGTFMALGLLHILLISIFSCYSTHLTGSIIIWLVVSTPLKNMKVSWDDDIPNIWKIKNVPNHQPEYFTKPEIQGQRSSMLQPAMAADDSTVHSPWFQGSVTTWGHSNSSKNSSLIMLHEVWNGDHL